MNIEKVNGKPHFSVQSYCPPDQTCSFWSILKKLSVFPWQLKTILALLNQVESFTNYVLYVHLENPFLDYIDTQAIHENLFSIHVV